VRLPIARARAEHFGGIVEIETPRALLHVDRARMRRLGLPDSSRWIGPDDGPAAQPDARALSAPTEVHVVLSRRCAAGCKGCYVDATPQGAALSYAEACAIIDELAEMGVFHIALGGGEALELDYLFAVAEHAVARGIVPNLTTSGLGLGEALAARCRVFGQINVSIDGVGEAYGRARGFDGFRHAEEALRRLRAVKPEVGINCVVSRSSFDGLPAVARLARRLRLNELELLRFKPVGRGARLDEELTGEQGKRIYPLARRLMWRNRLRVKLDCSFAPMVFWHQPSAAAAAFFGVQGCVGGDVLAAVSPEGGLMGCSFAGPPEADARAPGAMRAAWETGFSSFRDFARAPSEPCASCAYLPLCRGGCRAVSHAHGRFADPDPGCPRVQEWQAKHPPRESPPPFPQHPREGRSATGTSLRSLPVLG
jgi:radical SAM protein with 4Fe4S-binding SPASM domain